MFPHTATRAALRREIFPQGRASFSASFGDLILDNCIFDSLEAVTDSGSIEGSDIQTGSLIAENDFGSTAFRSTAVTSARITASSGDILLEAQGLKTLEGSNDFGDTRICLSDPLSSYSCNLSADFGDIILPDDVSGGPCLRRVRRRLLYFRRIPGSADHLHCICRRDRD